MSALDVVARPDGSAEIDADGARVRLTNLDRVIWPAAGFTKGDALRYYARVAPVLLPHVEGRPLTLRRSPDGVDARVWYQNNCPAPPPWLRVHPVPKAGGDGAFRCCVIDGVASILWVVNSGSYELHPLPGRADALDDPLALVFDLDPGPLVSVATTSGVALLVRDELGRAGLRASVKTSGAGGLHVCAPVSGTTFETCKAFARALAERLARMRPDDVTERAARAERAGKVLVDWRQNSMLRSTAAPYSLRITSWPLVSAPMSWDEVERVAGGGRAALAFGPHRTLARVAHRGDEFAGVLRRHGRARSA